MQPKRKFSYLPVLLALAVVVIFIIIKSRHTGENQAAPAAPVTSTEQQTQQKPSASVPAPMASEQKPTAYASKSGAVANPAVQSAAKAPVAVVESSSSTQGVVKQVLPQVPFSARQTIHGKVRVKVQVAVDPSGNVSSANLVSPGPSRYFARLALQSSQEWKFQPAGVNGQPAPSHWLLEYRFGRTSTEVTPVASP